APTPLRPRRACSLTQTAPRPGPTSPPALNRRRNGKAANATREARAADTTDDAGAAVQPAGSARRRDRPAQRLHERSRNGAGDHQSEGRGARGAVRARRSAGSRAGEAEAAGRRRGGVTASAEPQVVLFGARLDVLLEVRIQDDVRQLLKGGSRIARGPEL